jgi:peptidoglycan/LPS O-acetylase OafA/YrhL
VIAVFGLRRWNPWHRVAFFLFLVLAKYVLWSWGMSGHIRAILFGAGIILWEFVEQGIPRFLNRWTEYVVAVAFVVNMLAIGLIGAKHGETILVLSKVPHFYTPSLFVSLLLFTLYATFFNGFLSRAFSWDYLRWMGNISYSYYLIHGLALQGVKLVVNHFFPPAEYSALFDVFLLVVCISFTVLCGALVFLFVEKPLSWTTRGHDPLDRLSHHGVPSAAELHTTSIDGRVEEPDGTPAAMHHFSTPA